MAWRLDTAPSTVRHGMRVAPHHDDRSEAIAQPYHFGHKDGHPGSDKICSQQCKYAGQDCREDDPQPALHRVRTEVARDREKFRRYALDFGKCGECEYEIDAHEYNKYCGRVADAEYDDRGRNPRNRSDWCEQAKDWSEAPGGETRKAEQRPPESDTKAALCNCGEELARRRQDGRECGIGVMACPFPQRQYGADREQARCSR
ncbi:hypothetical protein NECAME_17510 [Necator americanus]|uniref:Uncharacterized protein n=1 Tax=Necator americanus TaxID=51031 RepID=W2TNQ2_NECAM|nr:hypothetical protein NECAME_17510 [Necator americanus]ETN83289.1 hypothetical protein NECAME_17510 [Necator americanus]